MQRSIVETNLDRAATARSCTAQELRDQILQAIEELAENDRSLLLQALLD